MTNQYPDKKKKKQKIQPYCLDQPPTKEKTLISKHPLILLLIILLLLIPLFLGYNSLNSSPENSTSIPGIFLFSTLIEIDYDGFLLLGSSKNSDIGDWDMFLAKTNQTGHILWNYTYGGDRDDIASDIFETDDGDYIILGTTCDNGLTLDTVNSTMVIFKINDLGILQWNKTIVGISGMITEEKINGNLFLFTSSINDKTTLLAINSSGILQWSRPIIENEDVRLNDMELTHDGMLVIAGDIIYRDPEDSSGSWIDLDFFLIKTDIFGNQIWNHTYKGSVMEWSRKIIETNEGDLVIIGGHYKESIYGMIENIFFLKTDSEGNYLLNKSYGGYDLDDAFSIAEVDNGFIMAGITRDPPNDYLYSFYIIKINDQGKILWEKTYDKEEYYNCGSSYDTAHTIIPTRDGGFIIAGQSDYSIWIIKTLDTGKIIWEKSYGDLRDDLSTSRQWYFGGVKDDLPIGIINFYETIFDSGIYDYLFIALLSLITVSLLVLYKRRKENY